VAHPKVYKTEAIVLKRINLGEADRLLTLYTPDLGKLRALAKGVRRPKSRLGGHVELLTHSLLMLARGKNLDIVTQGQTLNSFLPLRQELWQLSLGLYAAELVDRFTPEGQENYPLFRLLFDTLGWLGEAGAGEPTLVYFELHLLHYLGYRPQLHHCLACQSPLKPTTNYFSPSLGGMLCSSCRSQGGTVSRLSLDAQKVLRFYQDADYATARRVRLSQGLSGEVERVMRDYVEYLLEQEVRSARWLDLLRREEVDSR